MEPVVARQTWRTVEPVHTVLYFAPESVELYEGLGFEPVTHGYFPVRAAPMGAVPAEVVIATFFNFCPDLVRAAMASAWDLVTPEAAVTARLDAFDRLFHRTLASLVEPEPLAEMAGLARRAAEEAATRPEGRPLFAGHAALAWPDQPHLVLWHAQTLLREFRGDGHIAALTAGGLTACEALVVHAATGEVPRDMLKMTRSWPEDSWTAAEDELRSRGWLDLDGELTGAGRARRQAIEDRTDELALPAYLPLGEDGCQRLRALARPLAKAIVASGELGLPRMG